MVWTVEPTAFAAPNALLAARLGGARACLHVQDLEIEAACALRMLACARLYRAAPGRLWLAAAALRPGVDDRASGCAASCAGTRSRPSGSACFRTGSTPARSGRSKARSRLRRALGFSAAEVIVLYAGNMGEKQGLDGLAAVAGRLAGHPEIQLRAVRRRRAARPRSSAWSPAGPT